MNYGNKIQAEGTACASNVPDQMPEVASTLESLQRRVDSLSNIAHSLIARLNPVSADQGAASATCSTPRPVFDAPLSRAIESISEQVSAIQSALDDQRSRLRI